MKKLFRSALVGFCSLTLLLGLGAWGTFGHEHIARAAVFALPEPMIGFFYNHIDFLTLESTVPDIRKYTLNDREEHPRHFVDLENFGLIDSLKTADSVIVERYGRDFLSKNGILPWYIEEIQFKLTEAFKEKNKTKILFLASDLSHYIGDAFMPLHTSANHDGQLTNQRGIHSFWESHLPEMFGEQYDYKVNGATEIPNVRDRIWEIIEHSYSLRDSVLRADSLLTVTFQGKNIYQLDSLGAPIRNKYRQPLHTDAYSEAYHKALNGMIERQMIGAAKATSDFWYTAWVNAGRPNLSELDPSSLSKSNQRNLRKERKLWENGKLFGIKSDKEF